MHHARSVLLVIGPALLAACGGSSTGNPGNPDAANPNGPDARPPDAQPLTGVAAIPLTGAADGSFYTASVGVGGQSFDMIIDTGSTTTAVAGQSCTNCGVSPRYTPGSTATDQHQAASAQYGSGSWNGEIFKDQVGLGQGTPAVPVKIASITSQQTFFQGGGVEGLLGLGGDALLTQGTTSFLDGIVAAGVKDIESFQMCDARGGTMWLGGYDASHTGADPQYTAMKSPTQQLYYMVQLSDMKLGSTSIGFTSSTAIADTGTSLFYVPQTAANNIVAQANKATALWQGTFTSQQGIYCAMAKSGVTAAQIDSTMPPLTMTFPGTSGSFTMSIPATSSYMLDGGSGLWCIGITYNSQLGLPSNFVLMGDVGLRGMVTIFDRTKNQVGFAPSKGCPAAFTESAKAPTWVRERGHLPTF